MTKDKTKVAAPGELLGVEEEYVPGQNVYVEEGKLYATGSGAVEVDNQTRKIGVTAGKKAAVPEAGDIVEGVVVPPLKDDSALVRIVAIRGKKRLNGNFTGVLHVSQVAKSYVNIIHDAVNLGDRVLAKVATSWPPYQLSTADDDLGVLYSTCTRCGEELVMRRGGLFCRRDKLYERKKVSRSYLIKEG